MKSSFRAPGRDRFWALGLIFGANLSFACLIEPVSPNTPASASAVNQQYTNLLQYVADLEARAAEAGEGIAQISQDLAALSTRQSLASDQLADQATKIAALQNTTLTTSVLVGKEFCLNSSGMLNISNATEDYAVLNLHVTYVFLKFDSETEARFVVTRHQEFEVGTFYSATDERLSNSAVQQIESDIPLNQIFTTTYSIGDRNKVTFPEAEFAARFTGDGNFFHGVESIDPFLNENGDTQAEASQAIGFICNAGTSPL